MSAKTACVDKTAPFNFRAVYVKVCQTDRRGDIQTRQHARKVVSNLARINSHIKTQIKKQSSDFELSSRMSET